MFSAIYQSENFAVKCDNLGGNSIFFLILYFVCFHLNSHTCGEEMNCHLIEFNDSINCFKTAYIFHESRFFSELRDSVTPQNKKLLVLTKALKNFDRLYL